MKIEKKKGEASKKKEQGRSQGKDITRLFCLVDDFLEALEEEGEIDERLVFRIQVALSMPKEI